MQTTDEKKPSLQRTAEDDRNEATTTSGYGWRSTGEALAHHENALAAILRREASTVYAIASGNCWDNYREQSLERLAFTAAIVAVTATREPPLPGYDEPLPLAIRSRLLDAARELVAVCLEVTA